MEASVETQVSLFDSKHISIGSLIEMYFGSIHSHSCSAPSWQGLVTVARASQFFLHIWAVFSQKHKDSRMGFLAQLQSGPSHDSISKHFPFFFFPPHSEASVSSTVTLSFIPLNGKHCTALSSFSKLEPQSFSTLPLFAAFKKTNSSASF